ncbi:hypothetical protein AB0D04_00490 [Streptomyces sp. NPDC048483]|uniref:hypothetical protein n=1 Tax=Streptomyces sp. NPDC048483 TaxID=3154927 RepID=UPI003431B5D2
MRTMKRALALAATTIAVAGITFTGVAPANAAPAGTAAARGRDCTPYETGLRQHTIAADKYEALAKKEAAKAHPDRDKLRQYDAKIHDEKVLVNKFRQEYEACMR